MENNKINTLRETVVYKNNTFDYKKKKQILKMLKSVESKANKSENITVKLAIEQFIETLNALLDIEIKDCKQEYDNIINILGEFDDSLKYK